MKCSFAIVIILFTITLVDQLLNLGLHRYFGIYPRDLFGLIGIATSPLIHGNFSHVFANSIPLFVLSVILFWNRRYYPARSLALIWFLSGVGTWTIGRVSSHIGASSLVFGLVTYLIISAIWMKCWKALLISVFVLVGYGGILLSLFTVQEGISWEGHLSGAVAGFFTAWINHKKPASA